MLACESPSDAFYCPYCGVTHDHAASRRSAEHIVPYALGGSDKLTIITCARSNNDLGSQIDAPFIESFTIRARRFFLGLESNKGNAPSLDLGGTSWIEGKEVQVSYEISGDARELRIAKPSIKKTIDDEGKEHWSVFGEPKQVRKILEGKLKQQRALGKTMTLDGSLLREEDLDRVLAERITRTEHPSILKQIEHDFLDYTRFFSKLALAIGHYHLGESFSRSDSGQRLRDNMNANTMKEVVTPGQIWPDTAAVEPALDVFAKDQHHTLAIIEGDIPIFCVSLFGKIGAVIPLGEPLENVLPMMSDHAMAWQIALPSRKLTTLSLPKLLEERLATLQNAGDSPETDR